MINIEKIVSQIDYANSLQGEEAAREYEDVLQMLGFSVSVSWRSPSVGFVVKGENAKMALSLIRELNKEVVSGKIRTLVMEYQRFSEMPCIS